MCECGGWLVECACGDHCCVYCGCRNAGYGGTVCTDECPDDCMADHRGEQ